MIVENSLECIWESCGKECKRAIGISGKLVVQLTDEEIQWYEDDEEEFVKQLTIPLTGLGLPRSVLSVHWLHELANDTLTLESDDTEIEAEKDFP